MPLRVNVGFESRRRRRVPGLRPQHFQADPAGTRLEMTLVNASDPLYEKLQASPAMRVWDPWRACLARSPAA
jgi:hypothetical protein